VWAWRTAQDCNHNSCTRGVYRSWIENQPSGCHIFDLCKSESEFIKHTSTVYMFPAFIYIITVYCQTQFGIGQ